MALPPEDDLAGVDEREPLLREPELRLTVPRELEPELREPEDTRGVEREPEERDGALTRGPELREGERTEPEDERGTYELRGTSPERDGVLDADERVVGERGTITGRCEPEEREVVPVLRVTGTRGALPLRSLTVGAERVCCPVCGRDEIVGRCAVEPRDAGWRTAPLMPCEGFRVTVELRPVVDRAPRVGVLPVPRAP